MKIKFSTSNDVEVTLNINDINIIDGEIYYLKEIIDYGIDAPLTLYGDNIVNGSMNIEYDSNDFKCIVSLLKDIDNFNSLEKEEFINFCIYEDDDIISAVNEIKDNRN